MPKNIFSPLQNPRISVAVLLGSASLSVLLTVADPTPIRCALGLEPKAVQAAAPALQKADNQKSVACQTNSISASVEAKSKGKAVVEGMGQGVTAIAKVER